MSYPDLPENWEDGQLVHASDINTQNDQINALDADNAGDYEKPGTGIPKTDLAIAVQTSLNLADSALQTADLFGSESLTTGFCYPNRLLGGVSGALLSGRIQLDYFVAPKTVDCNNIVKYAGSTPQSGAAPTLIKFGVYSVAGNGDLTLIAQTTSDTALFGAAFGQANKAFTAACPFVRGGHYAAASLIVTTGTIPNLWGVGVIGAGELATAPRLCGQVTGQTDLPSSISAASVAGASSVVTWSKFV